MSSIKLAPNASGTGEFTIAAPNSNTNRTFNLPDQSGSFITTDSSGAAILPRVDSSNEGGQINFNRAVDNVANWSIDSFGNNTTPTLRFIDNGNVRTVIDGSGNVGIGTSSPGQRLDVNGNARAIGVNGFSQIGDGVFASNRADGLYVIQQSNSPVIFYTNNTERARIDSSGNLLVGTTSSFGGRQSIQWDSSAQGGLVLRTSSTSFVGSPIVFQNSSGGTSGFIGQSATTVSYNTTSDYRLKEDIQPMTGALAKVSALKPCTYTWKADGSDGEGFIAHELQEVCPHAVTGEKDAVDAEGNPVYQGIDTSFLVATLTAAIQEQQAMIQTLTARIEALEAK